MPRMGRYINLDDYEVRLSLPEVSQIPPNFLSRAESNTVLGLLSREERIDAASNSNVVWGSVNIRPLKPIEMISEKEAIDFLKNKGYAVFKRVMETE